MTLVRVEQLVVRYEAGAEVLRDISFQYDGAGSLAVIGGNGAGKTTLFYAMLGLLSVQAGRIVVSGKAVEPKNYEAIRREIGFVFQNPDDQLFMASVLEDVAFGVRNEGHSEEEIARRSLSALEQVRIAPLKDKPSYKLSGGEKRLAAFATVLAMQPRLLLLDEPTVYLDPSSRRNVIQLLAELAIPQMIATHDLDMVWDLCENVLILDHGGVAAYGRTRELLLQKELLEAHGLELPLRFQK